MPTKKSQTGVGRERSRGACWALLLSYFVVLFCLPLSRLCCAEHEDSIVVFTIVTKCIRFVKRLTPRRESSTRLTVVFSPARKNASSLPVQISSGCFGSYRNSKKRKKLVRLIRIVKLHNTFHRFPTFFNLVDCTFCFFVVAFLITFFIFF